LALRLFEAVQTLGFVEGVFLLAAEMLDFVIETGDLLGGQSGGGLGEVVVETSPGVGEGSLGVGGLAGGLGGIALRGPLLGFGHLASGEVDGFGGFFGLQAGELAGKAFGFFTQLLLCASEALQFAGARVGVLGLCEGVGLFSQVVLTLFEGGEIGVGFAELFEEAGGFVLSLMGEDVEDFVQVLEDLFLGGGGLADLVFVDLCGGGSHLAADGEATGFGKGVGDGFGGERVGLAQVVGRLIGFLEDAIELASEFELAGGGGL
jgi:hypothetical protein